MKIGYIKIFKFLLTGGLSTLIHYLTMFILIKLSISPVVSTFIGAIVGAIVNYVLQYFITFNSKKSHFQTIIKYLITVFLGIISNTVLFSLFYKEFDFLIIIAQILTTIFVTIQNFLLYKFLVFEEKNKKWAKKFP